MLRRTFQIGDDKQSRGMLDGFAQLFQFAGHIKQVALESKSTAQGELVRAVQTLEETSAKAEEAAQRLQTKERAELSGQVAASASAVRKRLTR